MKLHIKYQRPGPSGFRKEDSERFLLIFAFLLPWQQEFCIEWNSMSNFQSVSPKDHSCEIWLKLAQWFRRRYQLLTDDGQRTVSLSK